MLVLLGDHPPCLLFEQLFLEQLPEDIRIQLVDAKIEDHHQLVGQAGIWPLYPLQKMLYNANSLSLKLRAMPESLISCAITTVPSAKQLDSVGNHAPGREKTGPVASSRNNGLLAFSV